MCTFIIAIVPGDTAMPRLRELCATQGFDCEPIKNKSLNAVIPEGCQFRPVGGCCNCDTALGWASNQNSESPDLETEISKLKRKGWSEAKISRWRKDKERTPLHKKEYADRYLNRWDKFISEVLTTQSAKEFALVLHFFNGRIDTEHIPIKRAEQVSLNGLSVDKLAHLEWDVLYKFRAK
jgi:hypothetical protein